MNKTLLFLLVLLFSFTCRKKDDLHTARVQYEFKSDIAAQYTIAYASDNSTTAEEPFNGTSWVRNITVATSEQTGSPVNTRLTVYPPAAWAGTTGKAHITLKILVNGVDKAATDTLLAGDNADAGITETYTF